jgi:predicted AlkP superfamily pyrophosphatase or phosphodiesterase
VTLTSQASILTGLAPDRHGIVGNGWYWPELGEVLFWRQPHRLLQAEDAPTRLRRTRPGFSVAKLFWWFNMYAPVDLAVTPRPMYPADGRKLPDIHSFPGTLRDELQERFGSFPLFRFWGPLAGLEATRWIAAASTHVIRTHRPSLSLVYLPHLDYDFQRHGPDDARSRQALREVDAIAGAFIDLADECGQDMLVLSEYGITPVSRPVHPNRVLREAGLLAWREELGTEHLDPGASRAFAVADHQVAHVYVRDAQDLRRVAQVLAATEGVERVLAGEDRAREGLDHPRAGDLVIVAEPDAWFTYYWWLDDARAPDYARTVDIHRKPGYDPAELFLDPRLTAPRLRIARRLLARRLGFRNLLDVIGLDAGIVRGSHGRRPGNPEDGPILLASRPLPEWDGRAPFPLERMPALFGGLTP